MNFTEKANNSSQIKIQKIINEDCIKEMKTMKDLV